MKNNDLGQADILAPSDLLEPILGLMETDGEMALPPLAALLERYAGDPRLHFMYGSLMAGLERYTEARAAMQKAIDIAPDYMLARFQLGFLALTSGDTAGARSVWSPLLNLPAENPLKLFVQGLSAMLAGNLDQAISRLEDGIARNGEVVPLNRNMAILIQDMRDRLKLRVTEGEVASDAHFLLKQYSFKDTRH